MSVPKTTDYEVYDFAMNQAELRLTAIRNQTIEIDRAIEESENKPPAMPSREHDLLETAWLVGIRERARAKLESERER
jgi:hypothetical protein